MEVTVVKNWVVVECSGSKYLLGVVGGVAHLSEGLASLGNLGLVGGKSVPESGQDLGVHLSVVSGSAAKTNNEFQFSEKEKGCGDSVCTSSVSHTSSGVALPKAKQ